MAIFVNTGRHGETTNGLVHSLARVISCVLQHGVPPEEIGHKLAGMTFPPHGFLGETSAFGIHRAKSISDLLGRLLVALPEYYSSGRDEEVMHPNYNALFTSALKSETLYSNGNGNGNGSIDTKPDNARDLGYTGKACQNCGSFNTVDSAECYVCRECGQSNGPVPVETSNSKNGRTDLACTPNLLRRIIVNLTGPREIRRDISTSYATMPLTLPEPNMQFWKQTLRNGKTILKWACLACTSAPRLHYRG